MSLISIENSKKGFTILEVVVAAAVLAIGLLAVGRLMVGSIYSNQTSSDMSIATTLAQDQMEKVKQMAYLGVGEAGSNVEEDYGSIPGFPSFKRVVSVSSVPGINGAKAISVTVSWRQHYNPFR